MNSPLRFENEWGKNVYKTPEMQEEFLQEIFKVGFEIEARLLGILW
jgi:hypothetical protein